MLLSRQLLIAAIILYVLGLVMIFNTSSAEAMDLALYGNTHSALFKQILYTLLGAASAYGLYRLGYRRLLELSPYALIGLSIMLLLVFVPGIGMKVNGARRWISIAKFSLQPSEFVKFVGPMYLIYRLSKYTEAIDLKAFVKLAAILAIPMGLIVLEPNNGTAGVFGCVLAVVCFLADVPKRFWLVPLVVCGILGATLALQMPYVSQRIQVYLHPELDLKGKGHQPHQAKIAAGSGGVFGKGPGKSLQKLSYLPEAQNDYIAAIFAEEYGFIGIILLIGLYQWLGLTAFSIAIRSPDNMGLYMGCVIAFLYTLQSFLNLGVVSGLVPPTGLNLPFFSQGGSSLIANVSALGVLMSIEKERMTAKICQNV
ncbi:MAG: putative lipid II flippase FtsW [Chlamydiales bacterium]|nr:putative lipid II flippase FtsW [Chlamydiales bacterium]